MKVTPLTRKVDALALTNPDPSFVSLCKGVGPANQEPFRAVRTDANTADLEAPMKINKAKAAASAVAIAATGFGVMQFQFDKTKFDTAQKVTDWLDAGGYSEYEIVEKAKMFEVSDGEGRFEVGTIEIVRDAGTEGVTAFVGKLTTPDVAEGETAAEPEVTAETVETAEKTDEVARPEIDPPARKAAARAEAETVEQPVAAVEPEAAVEKTEADAPAEVAPATEAEAAVERTEGEGGISEEQIAQIDEIVNTIKTASPTMAQRVSSYDLSYMAEVLSCLRYLVLDADYSGFDEATVKSLKAAAKQALDAFVGAAGTFASEYAVATKTAQEVSETPVEDAAAPAQADEPAPEAAQKTETIDVAAIARAAATEAVAALQPQMTALAERAEAAEATASEAREVAVKAERELAERVDADNARAQSRKAADDPVTTPETDGKPVKRCAASTNMLSAYGSRHAR